MNSLLTLLNIMKQCWSALPTHRPSFVDITEQLALIHDTYVANENVEVIPHSNDTQHNILASLHRSLFQHICTFLSRKDLNNLRLVCKDLQLMILEFIQQRFPSQVQPKSVPKFNFAGDKIVLGNVIGTGAHAVVKYVC
jgi:hypothetical protein